MGAPELGMNIGEGSFFKTKVLLAYSLFSQAEKLVISLIFL